jgi:hypothetical protein
MFHHVNVALGNRALIRGFGCVNQYPALAQMPAEVVKAAALVYDMGLEPELVCIGEGESSDQQHAETQERNPRKLAFAEGVAASDGNSAQRLHEVLPWLILPPVGVAAPAFAPSSGCTRHVSSTNCRNAA